jgi:hypothetical protein
MKSCILFATAFLLSFTSIAQKSGKYWQQTVDMTLTVSLNDYNKTLDGFETIRYTNNSPDTLPYICFHLWMNAYKNERTAFTEQQLSHGDISFYFAPEEDRGYINQLNFKVDDEISRLKPDSLNPDIAYLLLPNPLTPGSSITITTPFHVKLPKNISRGGYSGETFQATQWYPKPAVYDKYGWHPMPYLDQGEFYSEWGKWEVFITLPSTYLVAASGTLQDSVQLSTLKTVGKQVAERQKNFLQWTEPSKKDPKDIMLDKTTKSVVTKTWHYTMDKAHDFAWFASKNFLVQYDTIQLPSRTVDLFSFYDPSELSYWKKSLLYLKRAMSFYSEKIVDYPYGTASIVAGSEVESSGGMEYPGIALITLHASEKNLDLVIAHETGHNWFYGLLGSNERLYPWMDEGLNSFYDKMYENEYYSPTKKPSFLPENESALLIKSLEKLHKDQPIGLPAASYTSLNYGAMVYGKTPYWVSSIRNQMTAPIFDSAMKGYASQWKYKHPMPEDFRNSLQSFTEYSLDSMFTQLSQSMSLFPSTKKRKVKPVFFTKLNQTDRFHYLGILPVAGYNIYDNIMAGLAIHNYQLPPSRLNILAAALYSTGVNTVNGHARVSYHWFTKKYFLETAISGARFTYDQVALDNSTVSFSVNRITPSVRMNLYPDDVLQKTKWTILARSFFLSKQIPAFQRVISGNDTTFTVGRKNDLAIINQLAIRFENKRVLYPFDAQLVFDQGPEFLRTSLTTHYFLQYGKEPFHEGLQVRFFAGRFFYLKQKNIETAFNTIPYQLTLNGPRGQEDFTFSSYFIGRNAFDGFQQQQLMERDGFFKVSTDLLSNKTGLSDNWLMAINLSGDIPSSLNPLQVLPIKIPLKYFVDIGTYGNVWKDEFSAGRFLFDAGLQLSLLRGGVNVYMPFLYSKVFGDYFKSVLGENRFARTIAFQIDLQAFKRWPEYSSLPF